MFSVFELEARKTKAFQGLCDIIVQLSRDTRISEHIREEYIQKAEIVFNESDLTK